MQGRFTKPREAAKTPEEGKLRTVRAFAGAIIPQIRRMVVMPPCRPTNRRRLMSLMVFAHLLSSLSIAASGAFSHAPRVEDDAGRLVAGSLHVPLDGLERIRPRRLHLPGVAVHEDVGYSLALLARSIHEHYVVASEGEGLGRFHLVRPYVGFSSECYVSCATFHALKL